MADARRGSSYHTKNNAGERSDAVVDLEAQRIRDEVIRAMAEQGEDIESLGLKVPDEAESVSAPIAMPAWERVARCV